MSVKTSIAKIGALFVLLTLLLAACGTPAAPNTPVPLAATLQPATPAPPVPTPTAAEVATRPIQISDVQVQIGLGSPLPVEVVASGTWPDLCAQVAGVTQQMSGTRIEIEILANPADPACPPDLVGLAFRMAIPLNVAEMPFDTYTVVVNGFETSFVYSGASSEPLPVENLGLTVAYVGADGNLWLADASGGPPRQVTSDAVFMDASGDVVYTFPKISSDGRYIAARRDVGVPIAEGLKYTFGLWVYDTETGESHAVFDGSDTPPAGSAWKPGTHLLAYSMGVEPNYFIIRGGKPDPTLATGILAVDLDSGASSQLVAPENGYALIQPVWSPDGRFLSFDELVYMEGKGPFAYYDFDAQKYIAWDEPLGNYAWSPDGSQLMYDKLTYSANMTERIFTRPRLDGTETQVSPEPDQGFAYYPVYSPDGRQIAYLTNPGSLDSVQITLVVQDLSTGALHELGSYESPWDLEWSSDGRALVFSAGPHDSQQVYGYDLVSGTVTMLAQGSQPSLARP
jgi:Tol biopolymer transport system component